MPTFIITNQQIYKTTPQTPLTSGANPDVRECLTASKLIKESEKHIYIKSCYGFYVLLILWDGHMSIENCNIEDNIVFYASYMPANGFSAMLTVLLRPILPVPRCMIDTKLLAEKKTVLGTL